jgi:hypothetical protein
VLLLLVLTDGEVALERLSLPVVLTDGAVVACGRAVLLLLVLTDGEVALERLSLPVALTDGAVVACGRAVLLLLVLTDGEVTFERLSLPVVLTDGAVVACGRVLLLPDLTVVAALLFLPFCVVVALAVRPVLPVTWLFLFPFAAGFTLDPIFSPGMRPAATLSW